MAGENEAFHALITATDDATPKITSVKKRLEELGLSAQHAGKNIEHLHQPHVWNMLTEHVTLAREHFGGLRASIGETGRGLSELVPALGAIGAAGGLAELFETTERVAENFGQLVHNAEKLGTTTERLHDLHTMASLTDTSVDGLDKGLEKLNITMGQINAGKNKEARAVFTHIGADPRALHDSANALNVLADAFQKTSSAEQKAYVARLLFGRGGEEMVPILSKGGNYIRAKTAEAHAHNFNPNEDQAVKLEKYNESMKGLKASMQGFTDEIGTQLAPALRPIIDQMDRWVLANRDWLSSAITSDVRKLSDALQKVDLSDVVSDISSMADDLNEVVKHTLGWKTVLEGMAVVWTAKTVYNLFGEPLIEVAKLGRGVLSFGDQVLALAGKWGTVTVAAQTAARAEEAASRVRLAGVAGAEGNAIAGAELVAGAYGPDAGNRAVDRIRNPRSTALSNDVRLNGGPTLAMLNFGQDAWETAHENVALTQELVNRFPQFALGMSAGAIAKLPHEDGAMASLNAPLSDHLPAWLPHWLGGAAAPVLNAAPSGASVAGFTYPPGGRESQPPVRVEQTGEVTFTLNVNGMPPGTTSSVVVSGNDTIRPQVNLGGLGEAWSNGMSGYGRQ